MPSQIHWVFCGITHEALMSPSWTTHELGLCSFDLVISRWSLLSSCRFPLLVFPSLVFRHGPSLIEFHWNFVFSEPGPIYSWFFNSKFMFLATTLHSWLLMNFTARSFFYSWTYSWILPGPLMITHETPGHYFWGATIFFRILFIFKKYKIKIWVPPARRPAWPAQILILHFWKNKEYAKIYKNKKSEKYGKM